MFAVIKTGGKQYKVAKDQIITLERLQGDAGSRLVFDQVLAVGATIGKPLVAGASVAATVLEQAQADKVITFKKKRRHNYRRKIGHRQDVSVVRIDEILTDGKKPDLSAAAPLPVKKTAKPAGEKKEAAKPKADATAKVKAAPKKAAPKKDAAKAAPAAKSKTSAAKKPAAKKTKE